MEATARVPKVSSLTEEQEGGCLPCTRSTYCSGVETFFGNIASLPLMLPFLRRFLARGKQFESDLFVLT